MEEERPTEQQLDLYDFLNFCLAKRSYDLAQKTLEKNKGILPPEKYEHYKSRLEKGLKDETKNNS
jgi:hypothetical protein